jgi:hypothetical protein
METWVIAITTTSICCSSTSSFPTSSSPSSPPSLSPSSSPSSSSPLNELSKKIEKSLISFGNDHLDGLSDSVLPAMDIYCEIFRKPTHKTKAKTTVKPTVKAVDDSNTLIAADLLGRKAFFLLLYALDDNRSTVLKELSEELSDYISTYFN